MKYDSHSSEILAKWYLRFNGYFCVDNFIVHAGDDLTKISGQFIGNHTETDVLAIRHRNSKEVTGQLEIQNDPLIANGHDSRIDFLIVEVKTGNENAPNKIWRTKKQGVVEYILRFAGFVETEADLYKVSMALIETGQYHAPNQDYSVRFVVVSEHTLNKNWGHLTNILIDNIIDFIVDVRGECWIEQNIGIASIHYQWDNLINDIFEIANNTAVPTEERKEGIRRRLKET